MLTTALILASNIIHKCQKETNMTLCILLSGALELGCLEWLAAFYFHSTDAGINFYQIRQIYISGVAKVKRLNFGSAIMFRFSFSNS